MPSKSDRKVATVSFRVAGALVFGVEVFEAVVLDAAVLATERFATGAFVEDAEEAALLVTARFGAAFLDDDFVAGFFSLPDFV